MDKYGKQKTKEIEVENVLVQPQTIYSGDSNNRKITANAIVFLFAKISNPLPRLDRDSVGNKLIFEGKEYTITNIVDNRNPYSNDVFLMNWRCCNGSSGISSW
ncbi:minor capsid protein [Ligilactobacillus agilis]|nr:minor capsid protein [Ligilactobacillus agilis]